MGICIDSSRKLPCEGSCQHAGQLPYAVKGKRAGIIEDCGGVGALNEMMQEEKAMVIQMMRIACLFSTRKQYRSVMSERIVQGTAI